MKMSGRVVKVVGQVVSVEVEGNAEASVAPCCTVPSVILEAKNPTGTEFQPGEMVEVTDGLGTLALGASTFLIFPAVLYGVGTAFLDLWWVGALGLGLGIALAFPFIRSLKLDQFPRVVRRIGLAFDETIEKEIL